MRDWDAPRDGAAVDIVDLRSDTVTRPTAAMYERMRTAPLGDDALDGDPTAHALEARAAQLLGKPAALFVPSCTMANLLAAMTFVGRGQQVVLEADSHMNNSERGGSGVVGGAYVPVSGVAGAMDLDALATTLDADPRRLPTGLVALETSHNNAGGTVPPLAYMADVQRMACERGIPVHIDGARLMNAAVHLGVPAGDIARYGDTVSLCLSKGLSAPVGAVLAGGREVIDRAHAFRRILGGQQRQVGIVAAAGIEALGMADRLDEDHACAALLAELLQPLGSSLTVAAPATNIVMIDVSFTGRSPQQWVDDLADRGVLVRAWTRGQLRCVTHRHITPDDIRRAAAAFAALSPASRERAGQFA